MTFSRLMRSLCFLFHSRPHCQIRWRRKPKWWCTWIRRLCPLSNLEVNLVTTERLFAQRIWFNLEEWWAWPSLALNIVLSLFAMNVSNEERVRSTNNFHVYMFTQDGSGHELGEKTTTTMTTICFLFTSEAVNSNGNTRKKWLCSACNAPAPVQARWNF